MPRLVLLSDTHGFHNQVNVPSGDILVHAGDFMNSGTRIEELTSFTSWWNIQPHPVKILIAGNHDILVERCPDILKHHLYGTDYLCDSGTEYFGLKFWGSPYQPRFCDWAFNEDRGDAIKKHWDLIPDNTDVLITHGPPYGILDKSTPAGPHLGCDDLWDAVKRVKPKIHVFGHIHGGAGQTDIFHTWFINASQTDESYRLIHEPIVIDI